MDSSHGFSQPRALSRRMTARHVVRVNSPTSLRPYFFQPRLSGDGTVLLGLREIGDRFPARGGFHTQECHSSLCLHHRRGLLPVGRSYLCKEDRREQGVIWLGVLVLWAIVQGFESPVIGSSLGSKKMPEFTTKTEQLGGSKTLHARFSIYHSLRGTIWLGQCRQNEDVRRRRHKQPHCTSLVDLRPWRIKAYTMVGDPHYMAPEQISGQGYGYGIDYWSLGILMYAMLHVETPFASHNSETKVQQVFTS